MISSIVFHLRNGSSVLILRYDYDDRCIVEIGDEWERTDDEKGEVTSFAVAETQLLEVAHGPELHVFMIQWVSACFVSRDGQGVTWNQSGLGS